MGGSPLPSGLPLAEDLVNQLIRTVLSPSLLDTVTVYSCEYPLDSIETISDSISNLGFDSISKQNTPTNPLTANSSGVKGGKKWSHILRKYTSLKELELRIPLDKDEIHDILDSLKDNYSLKTLWLSEGYHSHHFTKLKQPLDPRISLTKP